MPTPSGTDAFEQFVALLDYPMFVVTTRAGDQRAGCLVGFATQVSIHPSRFLVGLSKRNHTYRTARLAARSEGVEHLAVHLLGREHRELARLFGGETGDRVDKFRRCSWSEGPEGLPILHDAAAWFAGRVVRRFDLGDHVGHLLEPLAGDASAKLNGLITYSDVKDLAPGREA
ncbi:MAG TPA: flavin reductase family protein [Mycobacterium sp.]|nr:flavin reductase family protein [Mycobacterium sp.]HQC75695.1 flavin reductase family protein [Mycobacterium sp.]